MTEYRTLSVEIDTKERFKTVQEELDCDTQTEALDRLIESYQFHRLKDDKRIKEARQVVAQDHDVDPADVSLACLLKVTCTAYNGFQMTDGWEIEGESHA